MSEENSQQEDNSELIDRIGVSSSDLIVSPPSKTEKGDQPRNLRGKFTSDPGESFLPGMVAGIPGVKAKIGHIVTDLVGDIDGIDPEDDNDVSLAALADEVFDHKPSSGSKRVTKIDFNFDEFGSITGFTKIEE